MTFVTFFDDFSLFLRLNIITIYKSISYVHKKILITTKILHWFCEKTALCAKKIPEGGTMAEVGGYGFPSGSRGIPRKNISINICKNAKYMTKIAIFVMYLEQNAKIAKKSGLQSKQMLRNFAA